MRRSIVMAAFAAALAGAVVGGAAIARGGDSPSADPLLRSGATRYAAYLRAERQSLAQSRRRGDLLAVRLHRGRLAPAAGQRPRDVDPIEAVERAARLLSVDGRRVGEETLLQIEARTAGAAAAFDAIRDALWARDKGLTGSIDERLAGLRAELDRHRRGAIFVGPATLDVAARRRLAAALDAYAWRLSLAAERVER